MQKIKPEQVRVYYISDDYRWLFHTGDEQYLYDELQRYVNTLANSFKENTYHLGSCFMTASEYEILIKNEQRTKEKLTTNKGFLKLVEDIWKKLRNGFALNVKLTKRA